MTYYSRLFFRIIILISRPLAITYGGIVLLNKSCNNEKVFISVQRNHNTNSNSGSLRLRINPFLKKLGYLSILAVLTSISLSSYLSYQSYGPFLSKLPTINKSLFYTSNLLTILKAIAFVTAAQFKGKAALEFFADFKINKKQFLILILVLMMAIVEYVITLGLGFAFWLSNDFLESIHQIQNNTIEDWNVVDQTKDFVAFAFFSVVQSFEILSKSIQISLSIVCYLKLQNLLKNFNVDTLVSRYIRIRQQFQELDSNLNLVLLSHFAYTTGYLLFNVYLATSGAHSGVQIFQCILCLVMLVTCCLIHGLPHVMSKKILTELDNYFVEGKINPIEFSNLKSILSESVGFSLLGVKYDESLIGPVFAFVLSYFVILVQTRSD